MVRRLIPWTLVKNAALVVWFVVGTSSTGWWSAGCTAGGAAETADGDTAFDDPCEKPGMLCAFFTKQTPIDDPGVVEALKKQSYFTPVVKSHGKDMWMAFGFPPYDWVVVMAWRNGSWDAVLVSDDPDYDVVRDMAFPPDGGLVLVSARPIPPLHVSKQSDNALVPLCEFQVPPTAAYREEGLPCDQSHMLGHITSAAYDSQGRLWMLDCNYNRVLRIEQDWTVWTVAGPTYAEALQMSIDKPNWPAPKDWTGGFAGDGGLAKDARFDFMCSGSGYINVVSRLVISEDDSVYISDTYNHRVRVIRPDGTIWTVAGGGDPALVSAGDISLGNGGPATSATLNRPQDIAVDAAGNLYIDDREHWCIRRVDTQGTISTIAGICGQKSQTAFEMGIATDTPLDCSQPSLAVPNDGYLYIGCIQAKHLASVKGALAYRLKLPADE